MTNNTTTSKIMGNLVDLDRGLISREIFTSEALYQQSLERVFARSWLFVGHVSQVPNPNDFFVSRMGEESVILTRDRQGEIHVLLNTCMHRGMKVCRYDEGNTPVFSCPYHGWSYSTDGNLVSVPGELIGVPQFATAYHGELKKENWGLISAPKMHIYKGTVWACWDKDAPEWDDYMGDMKLFLQGAFDNADGDEGDVEAMVGVQKFVIPTNWMYPSENFIWDLYHGISHRSVDLVGIAPQGGSGRHTRRNYGSTMGGVMFSELGHGTLRGVRETADTEYVDTWPNSPEVDDFYRDAHQKRTARIRNGERRYRPGPATIFPNCSFFPDPWSIFVWHPAGPMQMELWAWFFVDKKTPQSAREAMRHYAIRYFGPAGMTHQDDMENWNYATAASQGTIASRYAFNYTMGLKHEKPIDELNGATTSQNPVSELNARMFYKRWAEMMDASSWSELKPKRQD